jgi:hypothetical protein
LKYAASIRKYNPVREDEVKGGQKRETKIAWKDKEEDEENMEQW